MMILRWWETFTRFAQKSVPKFVRGPYVSSSFHAVFSVAGVVPYPIGLIGFGLFYVTGMPWLWLAGSTFSVGWYWVREYNQSGIRLKPKLLPSGVPRSFGSRYDPIMDVLFPTVAVAAQYLWLLSSS